MALLGIPAPGAIGPREPGEHPEREHHEPRHRAATASPTCASGRYIAARGRSDGHRRAGSCGVVGDYTDLLRVDSAPTEGTFRATAVVSSAEGDAGSLACCGGWNILIHPEQIGRVVLALHGGEPVVI